MSGDWNNVQFDHVLNTKTVRHRLYGQSSTGFNKTNMNFLRPAAYVDSFGSYNEFNTLQFSTNGFFGNDNHDIKYYWYGTDANLDSPSQAGYFDLPGDYSLDDTYGVNDVGLPIGTNKLTSSLGGCSFSVPLGAPTLGHESSVMRQGVHDVEIALLMSNETVDWSSSSDSAGFPRPRLVVTLWRSYPGVGIYNGQSLNQVPSSTEVIGGSGGNMEHWRLVNHDMGYLQNYAAPGDSSYTVPRDAGSIYQRTYRARVPVHAYNVSLSDRKHLSCKYMVGVYVINSITNGLSSVPIYGNSILNFPAQGVGRVCLTADVNVTENPID